MTKTSKNPLWKVILTDIAGVGCLLLVPFLGPLPGPGGIPLVIAGFGLLAVNHIWAEKIVIYLRDHSDRIRQEIFPNNPKIALSWDIVSIFIFVFGIFLNINYSGWFLRSLSIGFMALASTIFMLNRNRLELFDRAIKKYRKR